jgi:hypothetical protein
MMGMDGRALEDTMETQQTATPIDAVVAGYFDLWNETDASSRRAALAATWADDASYRDPLLAAEGYDALDGMIAAVHAQYPGHRFHLTSTIDAYPGRARWGWSLTGPDGTPIVTGLDVAVLADDGRLCSVTGFFEDVVGAS